MQISCSCRLIMLSFKSVGMLSFKSVDCLLLGKMHLGICDYYSVLTARSANQHIKVHGKRHWWFCDIQGWGRMGLSCHCDLPNDNATNCQSQRLLSEKKKETSLLQRNYRDECQDVYFLDPYKRKCAWAVSLALAWKSSTGK